MIREMLEAVYDDACVVAEELCGVAERFIEWVLYIVAFLTIPLWIVPYSIHKNRQEKNENDSSGDDYEKDI